jgi:hypothetical protein
MLRLGHDHSGHYKDRRNAPPYNPGDLIKPDVDDPNDFLFFHSSGERGCETVTV